MSEQVLPYKPIERLSWQDAPACADGLMEAANACSPEQAALKVRLMQAAQLMCNMYDGLMDGAGHDT